MKITDMCKAGQIDEAYALASQKYNETPDNIWAARDVGWALYYRMKSASDFERLVELLTELKAMSLLTPETDDMIFNNLLFPLASCLKNCVQPGSQGAFDKLNTLFGLLRDYRFKPSKGYSFLLQSVIKHEQWNGMLDFLDWWGFDNLTQEDYTPYINERKQKMMTTAERLFIAYSKAVLARNDRSRLDAFMPRLEKMVEEHPEMLYTGYYYCKLLLMEGDDREEALRRTVAFVRRKQTEFWAWNMLSEVYDKDSDAALACLLRAVNCKTEEGFLGKVRVRLAQAYLARGEGARAKHHIETVRRYYLSQGWRLLSDIDKWTRQTGYNESPVDASDSLDWRELTDAILCQGTEEAVAVVTFVNAQSGWVSMVYGLKQRTEQKLRMRVNVGTTLKINFVGEGDNRIRLINAEKIRLPEGLPYAKQGKGTVAKRDDKDFAFLKVGSDDYFLPASVVQKNNLRNGEVACGLMVCDYNRKKNEWTWSCVAARRPQS